MKQEELDDLLEACCFYEVGEQNEKKEVFKDGWVQSWVEKYKNKNIFEIWIWGGKFIKRETGYLN